jgi:hypothetical protein
MGVGETFALHEIVLASLVCAHATRACTRRASIFFFKLILLRALSSHPHLAIVHDRLLTLIPSP